MSKLSLLLAILVLGWMVLRADRRIAALEKERAHDEAIALPVTAGGVEVVGPDGKLFVTVITPETKPTPYAMTLNLGPTDARPGKESE